MKIYLSLVAAVVCLSTAVFAETSCQLQRKLVQESGRSDTFLPRCQADGSYAIIQCYEGFCFCANTVTGAKISKSVKGKPKC